MGKKRQDKGLKPTLLPNIALLKIIYMQFVLLRYLICDKSLLFLGFKKN
jgi:hypothetical protein